MSLKHLKFILYLCIFIFLLNLLLNLPILKGVKCISNQDFIPYHSLYSLLKSAIINYSIQYYYNQYNPKLTIHQQFKDDFIYNSTNILQPNYHIYFVKPSKIGGTTIMNILDKFPLYSNYTFQLYTDILHTNPLGCQISYYEANQLIKLYPYKNYIFAGHGKYSLWLEHLLANQLLFKFTMIRNPLERAISQYNYRVYTRNKAKLTYRPRKNELFITLSGDIYFYQLYPEKLIESYHLIGIMEQFDQSLIILKNMLNLSYQHIYYANKSNVHQKKCY